MSIGTYSDLKTSVANWLHRSDLTSIIPDLITMAESRLNRLLKLRTMETEASLTMTIGSRYVSLPSNMNTPIAVWLETYSPRRRLTPLLPENMPVTTVNSQPDYWCIDNTNLAFDKPADQAHTLTFRYIKTFALSDSATTNALLTSYPDAYLFATLLESAPYIKDDPRLQVWQERFDRAVREINDNENNNRSVAVLTTEVGAMRGVRFNINRGY